MRAAVTLFKHEQFSAADHRAGGARQPLYSTQKVLICSGDCRRRHTLLQGCLVTYLVSVSYDEQAAAQKPGDKGEGRYNFLKEQRTRV